MSSSYSNRYVYKIAKAFTSLRISAGSPDPSINVYVKKIKSHMLEYAYRFYLKLHVSEVN